MAEIPTIWLDRQAGMSNFKVAKWVPSYVRWYRFAFGPRLTPEQVRARGAGWRTQAANRAGELMQQVLVSGSAGFIGGYVVAELLERGYAVVGLDNFSKYGKVIGSREQTMSPPGCVLRDAGALSVYLARHSRIQGRNAVDAPLCVAPRSRADDLSGCCLEDRVKIPPISLMHRQRIKQR